MINLYSDLQQIASYLSSGIIAISLKTFNKELRNKWEFRETFYVVALP